MKAVAILSLFLLASPVFGELTKEDMRTIMREEIAASEKRIKEYIDLKIETVNARIDAVDQKLTARIDGVEKSLSARIDALDKRMDNMWHLMIGLFGLIAATIAVPQIIVAYRDRGRKELEKRQADLQTEIDQLRERIEALSQ